MSEVPGAGRDDAQLVAGRYRLLGRLGEGGMGVVWRARDELLGREVAVKEVRAPAALGTADVRRLYARLEREGWAAARISHRNVVTVYDVATHDGRPWIVMELVRGLALSDVLEAEGPLAPQRAAHIGAEVLAALRSAHEAGVLHRDVKPGNVLMANDGRVVLTDFGIAAVEGTSDLTMTGELVGSPEYLAPERALGRRPGPESDLWSLGVLLYAAVEGRSPFRQTTPLSTLRAVVDEELPPPRRAGPLEPVIAGLLRKDPAQRLSAAEAERRLRVVGAGGTPQTADPPAYGPGAVTLTASTPVTPVATMASFGPPPSDPSTADDATRRRPRRAAVVLAAGIAALLLSLGGLTYAVLDDDAAGSGGKPGQGTANGGSTGSSTEGSAAGGRANGDATAGSGAPVDDPTTGSPGTTGGTTPDGHDQETAEHPQSVKVRVRAVRDGYRGACPPREAEAPAFTATVTVGRAPASVAYRWATASGRGSDAHWQTLDFPSGDGTSRRTDHTVRVYAPAGAHHDRVRLEVRSPVVVRSNWVAFSVTCEEESPTDRPTGSPTGGSTDGPTAGSTGGSSYGGAGAAPPGRPAAATPPP
ncbi:protein kinase [Streptomyces sp. NPDC059176]|uniref:serine/threonine-protein kinase n=1 Tax=Streptomyces sp. NPDC059176 TaxID=3346758 RepID=UPI0036CA19E9